MPKFQTIYKVTMWHSIHTLPQMLCHCLNFQTECWILESNFAVSVYAGLGHYASQWIVYSWICSEWNVHLDKQWKEKEATYTENNWNSWCPLWPSCIWLSIPPCLESPSYHKESSLFVCGHDSLCFPEPKAMHHLVNETCPPCKKTGVEFL